MLSRTILAELWDHGFCIEAGMGSHTGLLIGLLSKLIGSDVGLPQGVIGHGLTGSSNRLPHGVVGHEFRLTHWLQ